MSSDPTPARTIVTIALTIVVVFGGLLGARALVRWAQAAAPETPRATVDVAAARHGSTLEVPCWSCPTAKSWPISFQTDLDLIAPLGDGGANAAEFFAAFQNHLGSRAGEGEALQGRRVNRVDDLGMVVAPDDELLLEAEPWVDQATMRFYPDYFPMEGWSTPYPNLLMMLTLARSWTARGVDAEDPADGLEDCRRAIRLGRLLRQDDAVIIVDLVGLACIHIGSRGIYRIAQREGDTELALLASVVIGEVAPQRLMTAEKITAFDLEPFILHDSDGRITLELPDAQLDAAMKMAEGLTERRFFGEVILTGSVVLKLGTPQQKIRVREQLERIAAGDDPILADLAQWVFDHPTTDEQISELYPRPIER
ncbi:MAG: hypothetical protein MUC56_16930 [Thermoanaerobaculales bacterium]|jgi:hypothetical protein|nr:hypothetical protein [Thermoanaerobaculales bacterium]